MGLRFDPVGGGQFKQAVQQLIEAESQPIKQLEKRKAKEDTRLKLFQEFKTKFAALDKAIGDISTFKKFRELKVDLGDGTNLMSVTIDKEKADPGQYNIEIEEIAGRTSCITNGFENPNDPILGIGFITLALEEGRSTDIYIDDNNSSLNGIAALINREHRSPVRASVIRDESDPDAPWKLLISGKKDGASNQIEYPEFYFMDGAEEIYVDDDKEAQNALMVIDGFEIELGSNDVNDFLPGVNVHLKQAKSGEPFTMTITEDYQKMAGKVKVLVDQINQVLQFIGKQNAIDANTDTTTTFAGDTSLQSMEYLLRNVIHQGYQYQDVEDDDPSMLYLSQMGVEFDKNGQLTFKEDKFSKTLETNFELISQTICGPAGFAVRLRGVFESYNRSADGLLSAKEKGLRTRIQSIDDQIDQKTRYLDKRKQDIVGKFARLEASLGAMQKQQQFLAAALPSGGGGNPISQLLGG